MSETIKRRVNFVVELTFATSEIDNMTQQELLSAFRNVLNHTRRHLDDTHRHWIAGVAMSRSNEPISYNWAMTDAESFESEDTIDEGASKQ